MTMTPTPMSVNAMAMALGVDRRTIARRLGELEPAGEGPKGNLYWLADVHRALADPGEQWSRHLDRELCGAAKRVRSGLRGVAARVALASTPAARERVLLELLAEMLWRSVPHPDPRPAVPQWGRLSDRDLGVAWEALTAGATLDDIVAFASGVPTSLRIRGRWREVRASLEEAQP
jgi:hypothetical protein